MILHTTDGGDSWQTQYESPPDMDGRFCYTHRIDQIRFIDDQTGWAVGGMGEVLRTGDGGITWNRQTLPEGQVRCMAVAISDGPDKGFVAGEGLFGTSDGGATWDQILEGDMFGLTDSHAIAFLDAEIGVMAGANGRLQVTNDGGGHWWLSVTGTYSDLLGISLVDRNHAWAAGSGGTILAFEIPDPPHLALSPTSHVFGPVSVGRTASQTFTITNTGAEDLSLGVLALEGADAAAFTIVNDCSGQSLAELVSVSIEVRFNPQRTGTHQAGLQIPSNDPLAAVTQVTLTGEGEDAEPPQNDSDSGGGGGSGCFIEVLR